jgi:hypothetical protein
MEGWCSPEGYAPVRGPDAAAGSERTRDCGIDDTTQEERFVRAGRQSRSEFVQGKLRAAPCNR